MFKALFGSSKNPTKERNESPRSDDQDALPLHAAIRNHEAKEVKKTADKGGEKAVAAVDKQGRNSLHVAAEASEAELIKVLVSAVQTSKRSELINAKDRHGCTPLFYACVAGSKKSVQELLRLGADVSTTNIIQETLLHAIFRAPFMSKSHVSVVQELLTTQKLPLNALDHENQTALQIACSKGAYDIAVHLLRAGADATLVKAGDPPLFWAVVNENPPLVRQLLESGADISQPNGKGQTLMDVINPKCEIYRIVKKHVIARPGGARKLQLLSEVAVVAKSLRELPQDMQRTVEASGIPEADVNANWNAFCAIMYLLSKKRIVATPEEAAQAQERKVKKNKEEQAAANSRELEELTCKLLTAGDPRKVFKKMRVAGQGGFGMVFQGVGPDKRSWAIKRMPHSSEKEKLANLREANFLKRCFHENICAYKATYECIAEHELYLIMELLEGGTLDESVGNNAKHRFDERHLAFTARELLKGLQYLHEEGVVHRDLKSANIMFSINGDIKIIDFGTAVAITDPANLPTDMVGSPFWMPPEMVLRKPHSFPADIWSMAVCLLELANHRPPTTVSVLRHLFMIGTGHAPSLDQPDKWSQLMRDFLGQCLVIDAAQRARAIVLLQHGWLSSTAATKADMARLVRSIFMVKNYEETAL